MRIAALWVTSQWEVLQEQSCYRFVSDKSSHTETGGEKLMTSQSENKLFFFLFERRWRSEAKKRFGCEMCGTKARSRQEKKKGRVPDWFLFFCYGKVQSLIRVTPPSHIC